MSSGFHGSSRALRGRFPLRSLMFPSSSALRPSSALRYKPQVLFPRDHVVGKDKSAALSPSDLDAVTNSPRGGWIISLVLALAHQLPPIGQRHVELDQVTEVGRPGERSADPVRRPVAVRRPDLL